MCRRSRWRPALRVCGRAAGLLCVLAIVVSAGFGALFYRLAQGPLAIGGLDDLLTGHARPKAMMAALARLHGGRVIVSHSPDPFARLPANMGLMLAGHTHCGQITFFGWAPVTNSFYGRRFVCGLVRERGNVLVVTAGLGTSVVPIRLGARPDIWLIEVRPSAATKKAAEL